MERRIGPKFGEGRVSNYNLNKVRPRLYEDQINFDRMRMYRLNRVREQLLKNDIGACILFDPINIRYATDTRNMAVFSFSTHSSKMDFAIGLLPEANSFKPSSL